jgi:hypothetical protein
MTDPRRSRLAFLAMVLGVAALYTRSEILAGDATLYGMDFWSLHLRRIEFVREALASGSGGLPGWYPRELLGTPFWSNLQSFPWIPSRLVLYAVDPVFAYPLGVVLAAVLAASFTWLYVRSLGWGAAAAALTGFSFAGAGFFAARVCVGQLPNLEGYPALPLLLWRVEKWLRAEDPRAPLVWLAVATACVAVAGHPQFPAYAIACALLYAAWMRRDRSVLHALGAMALGVGTTLAPWWPMWLLLGRSTRVLDLERSANDISFAYSRLPALLLPWRDGWPSAVDRVPVVPFVGHPNDAYFWDTFAYVGILPWLAAGGLLVLALWRRRAPGRRGRFYAALGVLSLLCALPWVEAVGDLVPGTYLRSPARLLYLTTFSLCLAVGAALQAAAPLARRRLAVSVALGALAFAHVADLTWHVRPFVRTRPRELRSMPRTAERLAHDLGSARVAIDYNISLDLSRRYDDVGFFDSIMLAAPYRALLDLGGARPGLNRQDLAGSELPSATLRNLGVRYVITRRERRDLERLETEYYHLYRVSDPVPRAAYFPQARVRRLDESAMRRELRAPGFDLGAGLMLPSEPRPGDAAAGDGAVDAEARVEYRRPGPDRIEVRVASPHPGFLRVIESWDPGWEARVDGAPVPVLRADGFALAVAVGAGEHSVELEYRTPGRRVGAVLSLASLLGLIGGLRFAARS